MVYLKQLGGKVLIPREMIQPSTVNLDYLWVCNSRHHTFSAFPPTATNVPLRVKRFCEADKETNKSENGDPSTSNFASGDMLDGSSSLKLISYRVRLHSLLRLGPTEAFGHQ